MLTAGAAAKLAEPLTDVGWARVIRTGRGYPATFIRMARAVGVEPEVREALGLPPLPANVVQMPGLAGDHADDAALADIRRRIEHSKVLTDRERPVVLAWCDSPEGQDALREKLAEARQRARIRQG